MSGPLREIAVDLELARRADSHRGAIAAQSLARVGIWPRTFDEGDAFVSEGLEVTHHRTRAVEIVDRDRVAPFVGGVEQHHRQIGGDLFAQRRERDVRRHDE